MFLKNKNIIFKIRRSKVTDYAALKSEKLSPILSIVCKQHESMANCMLSVKPENPFVSVYDCVSKYRNFGFRLTISMVD